MAQSASSSGEECEDEGGCWGSKEEVGLHTYRGSAQVTPRAAAAVGGGVLVGLLQHDCKSATIGGVSREPLHGPI